jgi:hypothetical protein
VIATVWFAVVSALIVFVTTVFPLPATAKLYEMLADILMAAIEVALGVGLVQSFIRQVLWVEEKREVSSGRPASEGIAE